MKTCNKCKETKDLSGFYAAGSPCKACRSEQNRIKNAANPEANRAKVRAWRLANPDKRKAQWRREAEKSRERCKEWYWADPERARSYAKAWKQANPQALKVQLQRRRALKTGSNADLTNEEWKQIWIEFDGLCFWCGETATSMEHIVPLNPRSFPLRGRHTKNNVVPACLPCNTKKRDKDPLVFLFESDPLVFLFESRNQ